MYSTHRFHTWGEASKSIVVEPPPWSLLLHRRPHVIFSLFHPVKTTWSKREIENCPSSSESESGEGRGSNSLFRLTGPKVNKESLKDAVAAPRRRGQIEVNVYIWQSLGAGQTKHFRRTLCWMFLSLASTIFLEHLNMQNIINLIFAKSLPLDLG